MPNDLSFTTYWNHHDKSVEAIFCCQRLIAASWVPWHLCLKHGLPELLRPVILARIAQQYDTYHAIAGENTECPS